MRKPNPNPYPETAVFAFHMGTNEFALRTDEESLGLVTANITDRNDVPIPPAVWLADACFIEHVLPQLLTRAAAKFLGYVPTELHIFLPEGGAK